MEDLFGNYIKNKRIEMGLPLREVATTLKIDISTLGKIERGERCISKNLIPILAKVLSIDESIMINNYLSSKVINLLEDYPDYNTVLDISKEELKNILNDGENQLEFTFENKESWVDKEVSFPDAKIKVATLFSGIGAIEYALRRLKIDTEIVFASDIDKFVKQSYFANYQISEENWYNDVQDVDGTKYKGKIDLLVGGSPCQSFSMVGKRKGFEDTRGTLFYEFARIVKETQPKVFIFENVKGLINHDKGNTFETIKATFNELGYKYYYQVLNAKNYGIPQHRERIFVVGFKDKKAVFKFPTSIKLEYKMQDFLEDYTDSKYYLKEKGVKFVTSTKNRKKRYTQINGEIALCQKANQQFNWHGDFIFEDKENQEYDEFIFNVNEVEEKYYLSDKVKNYVLSTGTKNFKTNIKTDLEVARPLLQSMHKMHRAGVDNYVTHNKGRIRKLTPTECLRLMGFRDDFKQVVSDTQLYRQAGNSIVVDVLIAILKEIDITTIAKK
ncbi:DNA (cytosine-5-)-methyltransferase [Flammeovirga sp. MY04]|uniref:DNA (cytosine-5-)-methyltransferase n=1 Tax=Flammeovirga sp. MY04 TaxID=1191459 RepID=UPI00080635DF|nr:DNA (cytosine-5-)-methyltransferase [Flammeovirga sp. MY04]ANQ48039.1 DNA (cytosine-5-)-methyltransferase [Flammeovirga sp. MY04]